MHNSSYTGTYQVRAYEVDPFKQVTIFTLANYLQEAAGINAAHLNISVADLQAKGLTWVLMRLKLTVDRYPLHQEEVQVKTYPAGFEKYYVNRDFQVRDAQGHLIAHATSVWLVIDLEKRSMISVPDFIRKVPLPAEIEFYPRAKGKLPKMEEPFSTREFRVGWHDLDVNHHVNNAYYVQWVIECLPEVYLREHQLHTLDMIYRAESLWGDQISGKVAQLEDRQHLLHRLERISDGKELAQATTSWKEIKT